MTVPCYCRQSEPKSQRAWLVLHDFLRPVFSSLGPCKSHDTLCTSTHSLINADVVQFLQIVPLAPIHSNPLGHEVLISGIHCQQQLPAKGSRTLRRRQLYLNIHLITWSCCYQAGIPRYL